MCGTCEVKDDFIGQTFPTPKGGVLTVVGVVGKSGSNKKYGLTCSICHKDEELFPELFQSMKSSLVCGQVPCGCSKSPRWSEPQVNIIARRLCEKEGYEFLGFPDGYKNKNSKFEYNCPVHGKQLVEYNSFVNRGSRCPDCGRESMKDKQRNSEAETIVRRLCEKEGYKFLGFPEGYKNAFSKFSYNCHTHGKQTASYSDFVYGGNRCPSCGIESQKDKRRNSEAETIVKELCESEGYEFLGFSDGYKNHKSRFEYNCHTHGKQTVSYASFVNTGNRCPDCGRESIKNKLRNQEAENIVKEICEKEGYEFLGFPEDYNNAKSKFEYNCRIHGKQKSLYYNFVNNGCRCPSCADYGYKPVKPGYLYVTNWINNKKDTNEFFKIGISNDYTRRIKDQARKTQYKPHQLIVFKFLDGYIPQKLERLTKPYRQDMSNPIITPDEFSDGTTEILQNWIDIIKILPELIDTIRQNGYTPEIEVGKRLYNKLIKLDKADMVQVILDHLYK